MKQKANMSLAHNNKLLSIIESQKRLSESRPNRKDKQHEEREGMLKRRKEGASSCEYDMIYDC
jgi:hypothetical protein